MNILKNRTVLGILCILISLGICFGITPLFNNAVSEKTTIVRVKSNIATGDEITADMLETVEIGGYNLPQNVVKNTDTIIGTFALADFYKGDYILNSKISDTMQAENAYLYNLDGTKQAISVSIQNFANGLSGKLESGDIVSVISANYKGLGQTIIPQELNYVEVISVTADSGSDANTDEDHYSEDEEKELPSTVTLLVTEEQSKILAELESDGEIHIALVYRGDVEQSQKFILQQDEILKDIYAEEVTDENTTGSETTDIVDQANDIINKTESIDEILNSEVE